ncbi:putative phosphatidylglycerophosphatase [Helianthus annuus]|uniref:Phosphatidylglycerophosphatase n=1 Tax=Helianthus annuus TaxID=4232 RepID=A0A251T1X7_HELAN|nr:phosphatidylglycerophosphate phosphatase 1, chloroplastic [Helianthus annuus]KAF5777594.1 putative phosphatidylglycerophosphatase [Helianthus annuus]KAJ0489107.1 putative phosphatidylglycerophosphatase [Helianthus annuus]KAJ0504985.1 putative phosphatidylglycerophosphatase [Helianthus annuus]
MLNTLSPPHQISHCCSLTNPIKIKLLHSSHRPHHHHHLHNHRHPNKRINPSHFSTGIFHSLSAIDKHQNTNQNHQIQPPDDDYDAEFNPFHNSPIYLNKIEQDLDRNRGESRWGISSNMWWADLKAAVGQRINVEGLMFSVSVITRNKHWVIPHVSVPDVRYIDWAALKRKGFEGVVFDKDNTLTVPYSLALWGPIAPSVESCKAVFGNNIAVFSNSAGLQEYDPDGRKARALEFVIGIRVIRHKVKKPAGSAEEIERHFGCDCSKLIMVGDRPFTDIVYGNRNGFLTILTAPLSLAEEPFTVKQVRKIELALVNRWLKKGLKPANEKLLSDALDCVKEPPSV